MRTRLAVLLTAMLTVGATVLTLTTSPASGQLLTEQSFAAYGTGTAIAVNALGLGDTTVAGVHAARSSGAVNSGGLTAITDEFGQNVTPALPGKNAYGRGTGLEAGLVVPSIQDVNVNQLLLSGLAQASAPPPQGPIVQELPLDLSPVLFAGLLRGEAQAIFDPAVCALGQPITFGRGHAANLQLLGEVDSALLATDIADDNVSTSRTFTYFIPNGDGTFGLVSETHQHVAPISVLNTGEAGGELLRIEVAGEEAGGAFGLRAFATGKPGGAGIEFLGNPIVTITPGGGGSPLQIALSDILGPEGLNLDLPGVATVSLGGPPRAINGEALSPPAVAADGTSASAAVDVVARVQLLEILGLLDLGAGHMEAAVQVPAGGVRCNIPIAKTATPNPAVAGDTVTWSITIPEPGAFSQFIACDLTNIRAVDTHEVESGNPRFQLTGASHGGVIQGNTVTWNNLGTYRRGDPPIVVTVTGRILGGSGVLRDTAQVFVDLTNCTGGIEGTLAGLAQFQNAAATGAVTLRGPEVGRGQLAATGGDSRYLLLGGVLLLGALGIRRRLRTRPEATG
ncbi:MAG TPA: hypothetical protein VHH09_06570 [Acidimicrobiales bacterium]|nr:hypothetical protein [Acidimicrobiales bacterium]